MASLNLLSSMFVLTRTLLHIGEKNLAFSEVWDVYLHATNIWLAFHGRAILLVCPRCSRRHRGLASAQHRD